MSLYVNKSFLIISYFYAPSHKGASRWAAAGAAQFLHDNLTAVTDV